MDVVVMAIRHDALSLSLSHHACIIFLLFVFVSFQDIPFSEWIRDPRKGEERICFALVREGMFFFRKGVSLGEGQVCASRSLLLFFGCFGV